MATQSSELITVKIDGQPIGVFDTCSGAERSGESTKHTPGGSRVEQVYPGSATTSDLTVSRVKENQRDHELVRKLYGRVNLAPMTVTRQPLDANKQAFGRPMTFNGMLTGINAGETNSSSNELRFFELTMSVTSVV